MASKIEAYVDTPAFIAFLDRSDSSHLLFRRLFSNPPPLVTSALVIAEGHGWFLRRYDRGRALQFLQFIDELAVVNVESFDSQALAKSSKLARKFGDQSLALAGAHGGVVMAERCTTACWSTDRHLGLTGVRLVISP